MDSLWYTLACIFLAAAETAAPATEPPVIGGGSERLTSSGQEPPERHAARRPAGVAGIWAGFFLDGIRFDGKKSKKIASNKE